MSGQQTALLTGQTTDTAPAPYPADFEQRLERVVGIRLVTDAPLPADIPWQTAENHPPTGAPEARKGGTLRLPNAGPFPAHFLSFGGGDAQFFHQNMHAATSIPLVATHPRTGQITAGVAEAWAQVGNTLYFRLNPAARYTNGRPVRASDYLLAVLLQAEQHCAEFTTLRSHISTIQSHGEAVLSLTLREQMDLPRLCAMLHAAEPGFYSRFDARFRKTYAQQIPPGTGPYRVSKVVKGRLVQLQRLQAWWGEVLPLCRHRFNANTLEFHFLTSEAQVWEFFLRGKLDCLQTRNVAFWQEKTSQHPGIPTLEYDAEYPLPPYGIALNARTLPNAELRRGLMQAMDMDKAVQLIMRGEGRRLCTFSSGYVDMTPRNTPCYQFNPAAARACFAQAGYVTPGLNGILQKADGTPLRVHLLYSPNEKISALVGSLIQSAARCGAEIVPEAVPWQICRRRLQERNHEMIFWAMPAPDKPDPARFLAPGAAPDAAPFALDDAQMNQLLHRFAQEPTAEHLAAIDQRVYELAVWLPGWKENRVRLLHQPWVRIPPSPWCYDAADAHLLWIQDPGS